MRELSKFFGLAFSALLPLINPLGDALVFLTIVGGAPPAVYRALARRIAISTTIFLIAIEAGGTLILKFFGISLPVVQVAGGLALAAMGWELGITESSRTEREGEAVSRGRPGYGITRTKDLLSIHISDH